MSAILVVDDKPENLYLLQALLAGNGHAVRCAEDGTEALGLARSSPQDLVVSDILMPGMDGFALCREWRQDPVLRHIPFIFYTATYKDPRDEKLALSMGADRFLVKPMEPDDLLREVNQALARGQSSSPSLADAETVVMREYNQALVRKLEHKLEELETVLKQRDESERRLDHLNRVLVAIRSVNQLIVREKRPRQLIEATCGILVATQGFHAAWIVVPDEGAGEFLAVQEGFDHTAFARLVADIRGGTWPPCYREASATARRACHSAACKGCPLERSYAVGTTISVPLLHEGRSFGCLAVVVAPQFAAVEAESSLLEEVGGDLAFALHSIQTDQAHRESEHTLVAIFEGVQDGILLVDAETRRVVRANPAICRMLDYGSEELCERTIGDIHPAASLEHVLAEFERQRRGEVALATDIPVLRRDGSVFQADIHASTLELGGRTCMLGVFRDITERQQAEAERERLHDQLNQAQKMESVGRLAGGVAHDFNNMLSVILGHAEMVLDDLPPGQPHYEEVQEIQKAAARSAALTRQLLAFARKQAVAPKVLDLNAVVEGMLKMLVRLAGEDIDLAWFPEAGLGQVLVDLSQVEQILANLCVNARDAVAGTGRITIETGNAFFDRAYCEAHPDHLPGAFVLLAVSDDGCGMAPETMTKIFEPFFTTKPVGKGTGLGLATVYGIVKQNNGFITVYSEPGQGTTFRIYLPRHAAEAAPLAEEKPAKPVARGWETILLVEDEPAILSMAATMLERQGYRVLAAASPVEAVRAAAAHPAAIHLLITDVVMPEMNGCDLAEAIRRRHPEIKLLFMSGYMAHSLTHRCVLAAGENFLSKPFSIQELAEKVRTALESES
ncbi:MAG: response regulator [Lentisphaeria bacterium]|jgi:PAS domain S-box-containing protein|nr:response regulator [Lentisphaeria bacterium]